MPSLTEVSSFMYSNFSDITEERRGMHFHARCSLCGDSKKSRSKKRFHLTCFGEDEIKWQCFNCGRSGNFYTLYASIEGVTTSEAYKKFNKYNKERVTERLLNRNPKGKKSAKKKQEKKHNFNYILKDCLSLEDTPSGYMQGKYYEKLKEFVTLRKIDMPVYVAYKGNFMGRYIVPVIENGDIIYFQGRRIFEDMEPKYKNPSVEKSSIILNKNDFDKDKYIMVTEGLIDAYMVGRQGTSILGKELTKEFIEKVKKYTNNDLVIVMDNDEDGIKKVKEKAIEYKNIFKNILWFIMPEKFAKIKDLNELVVNEYINRNEVYSFILENSYIYLKALMKIRR